MLKKIISSFKDSYEELVHKTTWPSRAELTRSAIVVLVASIVIVLLVFAADTIIETVMKFIYGA